VSDESAAPHRRRPRYAGRHPRRFEDKYKEHQPELYPETVEKVLASGKTPAGSHVPIMVAEVMEALGPRPGETAVDCTLGYGGHARALLERIQPGGRLLALDVDPLELPKAEARLRGLGFGPDVLIMRRTNFAGLPAALAAEHLAGVDCLLADLGVSSMQLDTPGRGFAFKAPGPLDMRMNPNRGQPASAWLRKIQPAALAALLEENADEPHAEVLAEALAGQSIEWTSDLTELVRATLVCVRVDEREQSVRRVFQALRIAVNEEFSALDTLLRHLPACLNSGGRAAIITFHSGEDRRVKKAFQAGLRDGQFSAIADDPVRPSAEERRANPRAGAAKLRWARRSCLAVAR
jgi:16S rRNA (cytosine1402-N4)-methyltransferase